jgi:DNA repair protein RecN (Recombination protein N)
MLKSLQVKDYALIENIFVEFKSGLNIITGETGAGKSILIGAMGLLLGERAHTEVVRKGAKKSVIEGIFNVEDNLKVEKILNDNDIDSSDELIVRREISLKGSNRCFLNDTPVTLNVVKEIGNLLVDLHGQHEHQSLLRTDTHIEFLDEFGDIEALLNDYRRPLEKLNALQKELRETQKKEELLQEKKELYGFQIGEIDEIDPQTGEDESLEEELRILENAERLLELSNQIYSKLYDDEDSIYDRFTEIHNGIEELASIDKSFSEKLDDSSSVFAYIQDIAEFTRSYRDNIQLDPERLETVRDRIHSLNYLKKKYGGSLEEVINYRKKIGEEYDLAENFADKIKELNDRMLSLRQECGDKAKRLSEKRKQIGGKIKQEIEDDLQYLGLSDAQFEVKVEQIPADESENSLLVEGNPFKYGNRGIDKVEFFISTNLGEDVKPLAKIASGGEISRIMLALKSVLAKDDKLPLLIFDEIDVGVSGRIAQKVGESLNSLAEYHQIIAITHLPQIASLADAHFEVYKVKSDDRVVSTIRQLNDDERVNEVAKLISGEEVSEASLESARELINHRK